MDATSELATPVRFRLRCKTPLLEQSKDSVYVDICWEHPCIPASIRRPWQVWHQDTQDTNDAENGGHIRCGIPDDELQVAFSAVPHWDRLEYVEIAKMELAAFLSWFLAKALSRGTAADVFADVMQRPGLWEEVEKAWDALSEDDKGDWVPAQHDLFLASSSCGVFARPIEDKNTWKVPEPICNGTSIPDEKLQILVHQNTSFSPGFAQLQSGNHKALIDETAAAPHGAVMSEADSIADALARVIEKTDRDLDLPTLSATGPGDGYDGFPEHHGHSELLEVKEEEAKDETCNGIPCPEAAYIATDCIPDGASFNNEVQEDAEKDKSCILKAHDTASPDAAHLVAVGAPDCSCAIEGGQGVPPKTQQEHRPRADNPHHIWRSNTIGQGKPTWCSQTHEELLLTQLRDFDGSIGSFCLALTLSAKLSRPALKKPRLF